MVLVHGGNPAIRVPLHTQAGDPVQRLSLGGAGLLDLRGPAQYVRGAHRDDRAGHSRHGRLMAAAGGTASTVLARAGQSRHGRLMAAEGVTASPVLSVDVNAGE